MAAVPIIEHDQLFERLTAVLRMHVAALPILLIERCEELHPAGMQCVQQIERG